jgi:hypothetical protein
VTIHDALESSRALTCAFEMAQAALTGAEPRSAGAAAGRTGGEVVNPIGDDKAYNDAADAAIARVLVAEREAGEAIEQARLQVDGIVERARRDVRALDERTARRIRTVVDAFEREVAERLAEIEAAAERATRPQPFSDDETQTLHRAVRALAAELITAPP